MSEFAFFKELLVKFCLKCIGNGDVSLEKSVVDRNQLSRFVVLVPLDDQAGFSLSFLYLKQ